MQKETFEVEYEYEGERLDKYVSILFPEQSLLFFQKLIKDGKCLCQMTRFRRQITG